LDEQNRRSAKPEGHTRQVWKGIGLLALLHLLNFIFPISFVLISATQLLYLIPALILCRKNSGMVQGLLIGAGVTVLLNVACFGIVLGNY
jgi:hypothetical protein